MELASDQAGKEEWGQAPDIWPVVVLTVGDLRLLADGPPAAHPDGSWPKAPPNPRNSRPKRHLPFQGTFWEGTGAGWSIHIMTGDGVARVCTCLFTRPAGLRMVRIMYGMIEGCLDVWCQVN